MVQDAWRAYLELALGLTKASKKKATKIAKRLVDESGAKAGQAQAIAEELISNSLANREAVAKLVRYEIDRALGRVGLATADEVTELTERVQELERKLRTAETRAEPTASSTTTGAARTTTAARPRSTTPRKATKSTTSASTATTAATLAKKTVRKAASTQTPAKKASRG